MNIDSLQTLPEGLSEMAERPAPAMEGRSVSAANNISAGDMMLEAEFQKMLDRERSRPSLLWDDRPYTEPKEQAPRSHQAPVETPAQPGSDHLLNQLHTLENERQSLYQQTQQIAQEAQRSAQTAAYYQQLYQQSQNQSSTTGVSASRGAESSSSDNDIRYDVARTRLLAEAMDLEKQYPGAFDRQQVAQYARLHGYRTLSDAWRNMIGEASLGAYQQSVARQQEAEAAEYQQYVQWRQQQTAGAPRPQQQQYSQPPEDYSPARTQGYAPSIEPPPASEAVVMRPGARSSGVDPLDARRPTSWNEVAALSMHDARRVFGPNI